MLFQRSLRRALAHDALNISQSAAYSAMVALFPALIVASAVVGLLPDSAPIRFELAVFFDRVLPSDVSPLLASYFSVTEHTATSGRALVVAILVSITGASSVIATFMEGVRRAYELPSDCFTFWQRRGRALALVPMSLIPLAAASILVVFGHYLSRWLATYSMPQARTLVYVTALLIRWSVSLAGSVGVIALLYHMSTPIRQRWGRTLPGAILATVMWFLSHPCLRLVRHALCQLLARLWVARRRHRPSVLALHHLAQRSQRRRVQRPDRRRARRRETGAQVLRTRTEDLICRQGLTPYPASVHPLQAM